MRKFEYTPSVNPPFQRIEDAVRTTGLSAYFLRRGCRDGSVPCVRSGRTIYIDVPQLLAKLSRQTETAVHGGVCDGKAKAFSNF